jgi:hypothetical protein
MRSSFFDFAHVLFGKPVPTFPEHAQGGGTPEVAVEKEIDMQALSAAIAGFLACHILTCRFLVQEGVIDKDRFSSYLETAMAEMAPGLDDKRTLFSLRQLIAALRAPPTSPPVQ